MGKIDFQKNMKKPQLIVFDEEQDILFNCDRYSTLYTRKELLQLKNMIEKTLNHYRENKLTIDSIIEFNEQSRKDAFKLNLESDLTIYPNERQ